MRNEQDYCLLNHNTFGMNVKARRYVEYDSEAELKDLIPTLSGEVLHMGGGSNLLFQGDYAGTVLHSAIKGIEVVDETADEVHGRLLRVMEAWRTCR